MDGALATISANGGKLNEGFFSSLPWQSSIPVMDRILALKHLLGLKIKKTGKFKYHHNSCIPDNYELMKRDSVIDCSKIEKDQKHYQMALENCRVNEEIKKKAGK